MRGDSIALDRSTLNVSAGVDRGGPISLISRGDLEIRNSNLISTSGISFGGTVGLQAGNLIELTCTLVDAHGHGHGGSITMAAPLISLSDSTLDVRGGSVKGGTIVLSGTEAVILTNGTSLLADASSPILGQPVIRINGGRRFISQQTTISAGAFLGGGIIHVEATTVCLTDTLITTSNPSLGGSITVNAEKTTLKNSQILSTAAEGQGGTIDITSPPCIGLAA